LNPVFRSKSSCAPLDNRPGFLFFVSAHSLQRQPVADKPHRRGARNRRAEIGDPRCAPTGK